MAIAAMIEGSGARGVEAVSVQQLSRRRVMAVWAAAALPMGALSWGVAPLLARGLEGPLPLARALIVTMTAGLVWQFLLVLALVRREQGNVRWATLREALWLRAPSDERTGRRGGRLWWVLVPASVIFALEQLVPSLPVPGARDLGELLGSQAGRDFFDGAWGWFTVLVVMALFNTVLGEELLFRGYLLPRMARTFGRSDWLVNGALFATYHVHMPWAIPTALIDAFALSWPSRRYRSALIGIAVHSLQSVFILLGVFVIVV